MQDFKASGSEAATGRREPPDLHADAKGQPVLEAGVQPAQRPGADQRASLPCALRTEDRGKTPQRNSLETS